MKPPFRILFVCTGNICRSPLAEGVFRHVISEAGVDDKFSLASCGTGSWHKGEKAHRLSRAVAKKNGISIENHYAKVFEQIFFEEYDLILAMDQSHLDDLHRMKGISKTPIELFRKYDSNTSDGLDVPDPYYGSEPDYDHVFEMVLRCSHGLLKTLTPLKEFPLPLFK